MNFNDIINQISKTPSQIHEEELKRQKIERFTQYFGRVNSAFTFRKVTVKVENSSVGAPAWSGSSEVTFNSRLIGDLNDSRSIAGIKGLDLHEISHILYTPREGSEIFEWVQDNKYFMAYNALEDQRIETLFTSKYPSTINWFTATILIHFADKADTFLNSYPLLRGRRYLPVELRAQSRNLYPHQDKIQEICEIVDAYRTLIYPADTDKGKDLIARFHDLLPKKEGEGDGSGSGSTGIQVSSTGDPSQADVILQINDPFGHGQRPSEGIESSASSRPVPPKKQAQDQRRAQQNDQADDADLAEQMKNKPVIEIDIDQIDFNDDADQGSEQGSDQESDLDADQESDHGSDQSSGGDSAGDTGSDKIDTMINDLLDQILDQNETEINDIMRTLGGLPSLATNNSKEPDLDQFRNVSPDATTFQASLAFSRELERLRAEFDPAWERYESQGRLNAHRYMRGDDLDSVFDRWNEGKEDATEIECVIVLDNSGSMSGQKATNAYRAMYAIKRALDKINAHCTVITFSDSTHTLYRATDKAGSTIRDAGTGGGTVADQAIKYSTKLLAESDKPVKIFFAITDGEWSGDQTQNHESIDRLARAGVLTSLAYIPSGDFGRIELNRESTHHCEISTIVNNPLDLIGLVRSIVRYGVKRRLISA